jgi:pterin-4a-carbinolamine dehydratase
MSNRNGFIVNRAGHAPGQQKLKAERVQLPEARIRELLSHMPGWELAVTGQSIGREWRFPQPRVAAAYVAYVAGLAAAEGQAVQIALSGGTMSVILTTRLSGGSREGLTERDFRFAARLG